MINRMYKLEKVTSNDELRPALNHILIEKDYAVATNGHVLAKVPMELNGETAGLLNPAALTAARKYQKLPDLNISIKDNVVTINEIDKIGLVKKDVHLLTRYTLGGEDEAFPNWKSVIPKQEQKHKIGFNVNLLNDLAEAMGTDSIVLEIDICDRYKGMIVRPLDVDNKAAGLLMPLRIDNHLTENDILEYKARIEEIRRQRIEQPVA
jgi:DNA polymerase III sliding clamp (beta) subunit (PCNA family)